MAGLNKVFLIGNITRDPELRYTPSGAPVSDLGLATNRVYTTKEGERREEVLFVDVTVWNRDAENCCQYLRKGSLVHVEGALRMDSWDDKATGEKRTKIRVVADRVQFLDSKRDSGVSGTSGQSDYAHEEPPAGRRSSNGAIPERPSGGSPAPARRPPPASPPPSDSEGEDIPF
jgi:single-strand DNA-binding protein